MRRYSLLVGILAGLITIVCFYGSHNYDQFEMGYNLGYCAEAKYNEGYEEAYNSEYNIEQAGALSESVGGEIVLKNPTFEEVRDFIIKDNTSRNEFLLNQYECRHFATEVNNSAETAGFRCGFVLLCYARGQHAVIAFDTTDRGLIYIEPQTDAAIHPEVGGEYQGRDIKEIIIAW